MGVRRHFYVMRILDHFGSLIREIALIHDIKFSRVYNDVGTFSAALISHDAKWALENLSFPDSLNYIVIMYGFHPLQDEPIKLGSYLIKLFNPWYDESGQFFYQLGGTSLETLLSQRLLIPEEDPRYDDLEAVHITEAGVMSTVIAELVEYHLGTSARRYRQIGNLEVIEHTGNNRRGGGRWDFDNLLDVVQELSLAKGLDFYMEYNEESHKVEFHIGTIYTDKRENNSVGNIPFIVSENFGNLFQPSLTFDYQNEKNALYLRQEADDDTEQRLILRMSSPTESIPYNRIEFEHNNTRKDEDETNVKLLTDGEALLNENLSKVELDVNLTNELQNRFLVDWEFGDLITAKYLNTSFDYRIDRLEISLSGGQESISMSITKLDDTVYGVEESDL